MKEKLLLIAYRAWGDWLYTVPVLPYLFKVYDVYLETNYKISQLVYNDPRFKQIDAFLYEQFPKEEWSERFAKRWLEVEEKLQPHHVINLNGSLELQCIAENFQPEFYESSSFRRGFFGQHSFYNAVFERCGVPIPKELKLDELWYSREEINIVETWRRKNLDKFIIIVPIAGSTSQKVFHNFKDFIYTALDEFPQSVVYLAGDDKCSKVVPKHNRIKNMCSIPIKQSFLMARYANYVLGPETGVVVAAGMWGTPKTMLCTTSSIYQCTKHHKNDFSIQAPVPCSPCHRAIYHTQDCEDMRCHLETKTHYPACSKSFKVKNLIEQIRPFYNSFRGSGNIVPPPFDGVPPSKISKVR